jgi:hypothetical protein
MNADGHLQRAKELEETLDYLMVDPQPERHLATITETAFGAAQQYIAHALETRHGDHPDTHAGMSRRLRHYAYPEMAGLFLRLDELRMGRWYGRQGNGEVIVACHRLLSQIRDWATSDVLSLSKD